MEITYEHLDSCDLVPGYIYKAGKTKIYLKDEVLSKLFSFKNLKGIGNQSGIRRTMIQNNSSYTNEEAFAVLINTKKDLDWPNFFDNSTHILTYYGDNKDPEKNYLDTKQKGNLTFEKYFQRSYGVTSSEYIAPFFYFERTNGSDMRFIGLAIPFVESKTFNEVLTLKEFTHTNGKTYENYLARFTVLTDVIIKREWLYDLKVGKINSIYTPTEWHTFLTFRKVLADNTTASEENSNLIINNVGYRLTKYRRTQHLFRNNLLRRENQCQLCAINIPELLVASHILPWSVCDDFQKNDSENGLLLCLTHDGLFDKGLISFNKEGNIMISDALPRNLYESLKINENLRIRISKNSEKYMLIHRQNVQ
ncbi:HNH endonuclease [Sutcliffiella horikoshii]|uniref:HNH endonuclease n=1 Tax=Sutcliffiella horikoshii TaxID=79883 RepID=UPI003CEDB33F